MNHQEPVLYYIHDPMCSWCWGFRPVWQQIKSTLKGEVRIEYLVGGLAPDSNDPMPEQMQQNLQNTWRNIMDKIPGTRFNFDFWTQNQPRRSTYPACRAVLLAKQADSNLEESMILAIQQAYYRDAKNPSDHEVLAELAQQLGLDRTAFLQKLTNEEAQTALLREIEFARSMGGNGFPSLIIQRGDDTIFIPHSYTDHEETLRRIRQYL